MASANLTRYTSLDITSVEGDTLDSTNATFTDDDSVDYSGYDSAELLLKSNVDDDDDDAVVSFTTSGSASTGKITLQDGSFYLEADPAVTDGKNGVYYYAMKVVSGTDEITVMKGTWFIEKRRVN